MARFSQKNFIVDSSAVFLRNATFDSSVYLQGVTHINALNVVSATSPYALVLESNAGADLEIKTAQLGTMAFQYVLDWDASLSLIQTDITNLETSVGTLDTVITNLETSVGTLDTVITNLETSVGVLDLLTQSHTTSITNIESSINEIDLDLLEIFSDIVDIEASLGALDVLTQSHTIDITNLETSVGVLDLLTQSHTTDITNIETSVGVLEGLINTNTLDISTNAYLLTIHDGSIGYLYEYDLAQDVSIALAISGVTAWNGLTKTDNSIGLGGLLQQNTNISTGGWQLTVTGDLDVIGNLTVDGSLTYLNVVDLNVSDNIITVNYGESGSGVTAVTAGIKVDRGSEDPYFFIFSEDTDTFRIGQNASEGGLPYGTQAVATREDSPQSEAIPFWNNSAKRFDTVSDFTFNATSGLAVSDRITGGGGLTLSGGISDQPSEFTTLMLNGSGVVGYRELGTGAFATIADYATLLYVDGSLLLRDSSIAKAFEQINDLSTGKLDGVASTNGAGGHEVYSNESNNVALIKRIVAGIGADITSDTSTITIGVSGFTGLVSKYSGSFDGTADASLFISDASHGLGVGPFSVSVYDNGDQVFVDVSYEVGVGSITLEWSPGSLSANCVYFITG